MRHVATVASRELRGLFVSPVAYAVLSLFAVLLSPTMIGMMGVWDIPVSNPSSSTAFLKNFVFLQSLST